MPLFLFQTGSSGILLFFGIFFFPSELEHWAQIGTRMEKLQSQLKLNNTEDLLVWLPSSNNFYPIPTVMWLWYDLPVQHSHTLPRAASSALPSSKSRCLGLHRRLCIPDGQSKAERQEQECNGQPAQAMRLGVHSKSTLMVTAGDKIFIWEKFVLNQKAAVLIFQQNMQHYSPCCPYSARKGENRFLNGDAQDTWEHHIEPLSPEMTSRSNMSLSPSLKSSSMFSICVPALRRWELHHAVNV